MSVIHFGTDGWRGRIARDFTFENVRKLSQAVADFLSKGRGHSRGDVVLGYDRRFLSEAFARITAEVLAGNGFRIFLLAKPVPTPLVSFTVVQKRCLGGIVLTASHNPADFHGFKFKEPWGASATPETTRAIEGHLGRSKVARLPYDEALKRKKIVVLNQDHSYLSSLWKKVDGSLFEKVRLRVLADSLYGSASEYLPRALSLGSVKVEALHTERDVLFGGVAPEPIPKNLGELMQRMQKGSYDIGVALDGDGDRVAAVIPGGRFIPPTKIFALLLFHFVENKGLRGRVVKTISGSSLIDRIASTYGLLLEETPVGFKHIAQRMQEPDFLMGAEESGGMGFRGSVPERDGILSALFLLEAMASGKKSIVQLLQRLRQRFGPFETDRVDIHYPMECWEPLARRIRKKGRTLLLKDSLSEIKDFDGIKLIGKERWILFRMSGTEPLLRIYAEGPSHRHVQRLLANGRTFALEGLTR